MTKHHTSWYLNVHRLVISDAKIFMIYEGTSQIQRLVISRGVLDAAKAGNVYI